MSETGAAWAADLPERLRGTLLRCAAGELPPNVALMWLLIEASDAGEVEQALQGALRRLAEPESGRVRRCLDLLLAYPDAFATTKAVLEGVEHGVAAANHEEGVARWAALFDQGARTSPEGSVALYSLGAPELLEAVTAEVAVLMRSWGLLGPDRACLDIGCGIGRFERALSPELGSIVGIDISEAMVAEARRRCEGLPNVRILRSSGRDLALFEDASFDLVLAVDSFPYVVEVGPELAETLLREAARVAKPRADILIFNLSYRNDLDADRRDVARLADGIGFRVVRAGTRDLALWDGLAFHLARG